MALPNLCQWKDATMNAWRKLPIIQAASFLVTEGELGLSVNEAKSGLPLRCLLEPHLALVFFRFLQKSRQLGANPWAVDLTI